MCEMERRLPVFRTPFPPLDEEGEGQPTIIPPGRSFTWPLRNCAPEEGLEEERERPLNGTWRIKWRKEEDVEWTRGRVQRDE